MKLKGKDIQKVVYLIGALGFLVGVHIASVYVFAVQRVAVNFDPLLTAQARNEICRYVATLDCCSLSARDIAHEIRDKFSCIETVTCRYMPNGVMDISLYAQAPFVKCDDARLATVGNRLVPADYYRPDVVANLATVHVQFQEDAQRLQDDLFCFIKQLNQALLAQGDIFWRHRNEIQLVLRDMPYQVLCNAHKVPQQDLFDRCAAIALEMKSELTSEQCLLADVRFADQIVISKIKG